MKKIFVLFLACVCLALSGCALKDYAILYSERTEKDGFEIAINETGKTCFVGGYECDEYTEDMEITIPDECNGIPVEQIGGFYGRGVAMAFHISLEELYVNISRTDHRVDADRNKVQNVVFNLNIGKNIKTVKNIKMTEDYYPHLNEDGTVTLYHPVVYVSCSEENKYFYSKDGKLYSRADDSPIDGFAYNE